MNVSKISLVFLLFLIVSYPVTASEKSASFYSQLSPRGSEISNINEVAYENQGWYFFIRYRTMLGHTITDFVIHKGESKHSILVSMPDDGKLKKGLYIAERSPFNDSGDAGFCWSKNGNVSNTLTATFEIYEVSYDRAGEIERIAFDFIQGENCSGKIELGYHKWSFGSYRFNSTIALTTPEAGGAILSDIGTKTKFK